MDFRRRGSNEGGGVGWAVWTKVDWSGWLRTAVDCSWWSKGAIGLLAESKGIGKEPFRIEELEGSNFAEEKPEQGWEVGIGSTRGVVSARGTWVEIGQVGE